MSVTVPLSFLPPDEITITTQFNDLRDNFGSESQCRADLLELSLFGKTSIIRDADVVNNSALLTLANDESSGIQDAIREGIFVFARREHVTGCEEPTTSFTEINDTAGRNRANPDLFDDLRTPIAMLDTFLSDIPVALVKNEPTDDRFALHIQRIRKSAVLGAFAKRRLDQVLQDAREISDGQLKFGLIYGPLKRTKAESKDEQDQLELLLRLCRAAHVLIIPAMHGLAPTTANADLDPEHVSIVLGSSAADDGKRTHLDPDWFELFPTFSLVRESLLKLSIKEALELRSSLEGQEYRIEMTLAQAAWKTQAFEKAYVRYLKALEKYMIHVRVRGKIEWLDWRKAMAEKSIARQKLHRETLLSLLKGGVPVLATAATANHIHLLPHSIFPGSGLGDSPLKTGLLTLAATTGLGHFLKRDEVLSPYPLSRLLGGTTYSPRF